MKGIWLVLFLFPLVCLADIYQEVDSSGNIEYSDVPLNSNAQRVDLPPASTASAPAAPKPVAAQNAKAAAPQQFSYDVFDILSPANMETIQNQPTISVEISIDPPLRPSDKIQVYLDGSPWGPPGKTANFTFNAPDRGTHTLSAQVLDSSNNVLKESNVNTIYVHQAALGPK